MGGNARVRTKEPTLKQFWGRMTPKQTLKKQQSILRPIKLKRTLQSQIFSTRFPSTFLPNNSNDLQVNSEQVDQKICITKNIIISITTLPIMSNFLFNCCNNSQTANYSQATISSISRNINNKPRKSNNINLPKSSLKTLASIRSLKSFQNGSKSTLTYTPPPTQHIPDAITRDLYSAPNHSLNNLLCTPQRSQILINPGVREVTPSTFSTNNKIKFSYSAEKRCDNEESILSSKNQNLMRLNDKNFRSSKHSKKQQQVEKEETISETIKKSTDMKKSQISGQGKPQKIKLGGSKFTVMSEQQVQQMPINETSMRLDESEIIINVFHATESQLQKWSAADRKNQQLQSTK